MRPKVAVVGLNHGYALARSASASNAVELTGLCTRHPSDHREQVKELGVPLFDSLDTMLSELDLDGVMIAAPTDQLAFLAKMCLARHISVLVEKPLGIGISEALEIKEAAAGTTATVVVGYYRRLARQVAALQQLLAGGAIGDVQGVSCKWVIRKPPGYFKGWKAARARGGGCLMINVIHDLDMLQHLLGPIEAIAAMESRTECKDDVEHLLVLNMQFRGGKLGTAILCDQSPSPYSYDNSVAAVSKFPRYSVDSHHFFGTAGSLAFPSFTLHTSSSAHASWYDRLTTTIASDANETVDDPITREIEHFAQVLRGNHQPCATVDDAIRNLTVVDAIRRALENSTTQTIPAGRRFASRLPAVYR